jgi:hypothetical protein
MMYYVCDLDGPYSNSSNANFRFADIGLAIQSPH